MTTPKITVLDYGMGNLLSVVRAFEHVGVSVSIAEEPLAVERADRLVLPGVGAFGDAMLELQRRSLTTAVKDFVLSGRPLLAICLGMQMLFDDSEEFGYHPGLGIIPGKVIAIPSVGPNRTIRKIPHIGWNGLVNPGERDWSRSVLSGLEVGGDVYFVHSYMGVPSRPEMRLADCDYDGITIAAAVKYKNVTGCQFHPEKSGKAGLKIIENFANR